MKESITLRKRFCKDYNLPINLFDSPYFEQRLKILDTQFNCVKKYELFMREVSKFNNEEEYFAEYNRIKDTVIQFVQNSSGYVEFTNSNVPTLREFPKKELYSDCNDGKTFFSIDMRKANFTTLSKLYPDLVGYATCWEDFMRKFTDMLHIVDSKYIRQVILGACNPKKQTQWERFLMGNIALNIEDKLNCCHIISVTTDEILIECESCHSLSATTLQGMIDETMRDKVKVSKFILRKIEGFGWVKKFIQPDCADETLKDNYEFKCVEADKYHILCKLYNGVALTDDDLVFNYNGNLATYLSKTAFSLKGDL